MDSPGSSILQNWVYFGTSHLFTFEPWFTWMPYLHAERIQMFLWGRGENQ